MKIRKIILLIGLLAILPPGVGCEDIRGRFGGQDVLKYGVYFNGIPVGSIEWQYLGKETVSGKMAHVLYVSSDADILKVLNIVSKEKVFIDSSTNLPLKVERDVVFFGKKELIEEFYNQEEGWVKIIRSSENKEIEEEVILRDKPIHNILALLYFFPKNIDLEFGKIQMFNLPTQKVKIKTVSLRGVEVNGRKEQAYFLLGSGDKKFNLWLDMKERLPLRMEFILLVGKITIKRKFEDVSSHSRVQMQNFFIKQSI